VATPHPDADYLPLLLNSIKLLCCCYTAPPGAPRPAAIAIGAAPPPRLARAAAVAHSTARSAAARRRTCRPVRLVPRCRGRRVRTRGAGQGWGAGRCNGRAVYLEQRPRGCLFLTAHTSFINRNEARLMKLVCAVKNRHPDCDVTVAGVWRGALKRRVTRAEPRPRALNQIQTDKTF
jgi:hypothetical protein